MRLHEAIQTTTWDDVQQHLVTHCESLLIHLYEDLYNSLEARVLSHDKSHLALSIAIEMVPDSHIYDVYGVKEGDAHAYVLSLSTWDEWLHYTIGEVTKERFSLAEIVAHCLWEMTYFGLTEEDILLKRQELHMANEELQKEQYIEEQITCPFCNGTRSTKDNEICYSCNEQGLITYINL